MRTASTMRGLFLTLIVPLLLAAPASSAQLQAAAVLRVIDGDTFTALIAGRQETVRLIGVDAPEVTRRVDPYGREAAAFARRSLLGRTVWLEHDVQPRDRYGRRLAYVWLSPSRTPTEIRQKMFNAILLAQGYARLMTVPPNVRYVDVFRALQEEARRAGRGLWGAAARRECNPSYPDVCIPPPPPDLDCRDIPYRRFRVLPPDPHRFDGDGDGIGCER